ncbi:MAG: nuclear transport factor 2 family protein [Kofleriaceae bacterium]
MKHGLMRMLVAVAMAGCGGGHGQVIEAPVARPAPLPEDATAPLPWLTGEHALGAPAGGTLTLVAVAGTRYGVWLGGSGAAQVWMFDATEVVGTVAAWRVDLQPGGPPTLAELTAQIDGGEAVMFTGADDGPTLAVSRAGSGALAGAAPPALQFGTSAPVAGAPAPELEANERLFATDSAERGAAAWAEWFADDGAELTDGLVVGRAKIGEAMQGLLAQAQLTWEPVVSRVRGDVGFTVGTFQVRDRAGQVQGDGSYVSVWKKDPVRGWRLWFDGGRPGDGVAPRQVEEQLRSP